MNQKKEEMYVHLQSYCFKWNIYHAFHVLYIFQIRCRKSIYQKFVMWPLGADRLQRWKHFQNDTNLPNVKKKRYQCTLGLFQIKNDSSLDWKMNAGFSEVWCAPLIILTFVICNFQTFHFVMLWFRVILAQTEYLRLQNKTLSILTARWEWVIYEGTGIFTVPLQHVTDWLHETAEKLQDWAAAVCVRI